VAIMLVNHNERRMVTRIGAHYKIEFEERPLPREEDVETLVSERLVGRLEARLRDRDKLQIDRMQRFAPLAKELAADEDGLALLTMLLDDTYHEWMHRPPELPPVGTEAKSKKPDRGRRDRSGGKRKDQRRGGGKGRRRD
jgi:ATP-dependent RNA helicase DeaD